MAEIDIENSHPTVICALYRPPSGSIDECINELNHQQETLNILPCFDIVFLDDANRDWQQSSPNIAKLARFLHAHSLNEVITQPTRSTLTSSKTIDHIWVNNNEWYSHRGVIETGLSDHCLVFVARHRATISKE